MTINKAKLNRTYKLHPRLLIGSLFLWLAYSFILYAFFQIFRETFRYLTPQLGDRTFLVLTPHEKFIYNLFYASIASALGYGTALKFMLNNSLYAHDRKTRSLIRRSLNTEGFFSWSFLLWFGRFGSIFGLWYLTTAMQFDLDFIKEFSVIFYLLPLVIFFSTWPSLSRLIQKYKFNWLMVTTGLFVLMSFGFAFKNFADYEKIDLNILNQSIEYVYELKVPETQHHRPIRYRSSAIDVYIARETGNNADPVIFIENIHSRIDRTNLSSSIKSRLSLSSEWHDLERVVNLHIDERIQMKHITPIMEELRKANLRNIQYSTTEKYSRYPPEHSLSKYGGIQRVLVPKYFPEFESFLDSLEKVTLKGQIIKLPASIMYRHGTFDDFNKIEIEVSPNKTIVNGLEVDPIKLSKDVGTFVEKYAPEYIIILNMDNEITYQQYIEVLDVILTKIDQLRDELSLIRYNQPFDYWDLEPERDFIRFKYPLNIIEWSPEEKRLNELLGKANVSH